MEHSDILKKLPGALLPWYSQNNRELPWRQTKEPYPIWLSEIMLQQTRVEAVKGYYARFLRELPTIEALAQCEDDRLHKLWEGLGYYSRVRNLKKAAQKILGEYGGTFPTEHSQVITLPGVGEYTAGAVCSICFDAPTPAVDGNVLRLISRLTDDPSPIDVPATKKAVTTALKEVYPARAGEFTQALMELGATLCGPNRAPECEKCPCREFCLGYLRGTAAALPVKIPKKEKRQEDRTVFIFSCDGRYALEKRPDKGLLAGLWQFPNISGHHGTEALLSEAERMGLRPKEIYKEVTRKHIFTHIQWNMKGIYLEVVETTGNFHWFTAGEISTQAALPTAFRQFWEDETDV